MAAIRSKLVLVSVLLVQAMPAVSAAEKAPNRYPERPIRLLLGLPAGGSADIIARTVSLPLAELLGQPIVVDNRPGARGLIAPQLAAQAPRDGYTLLFRASFLSELVASRNASLRYDMVRDFEPVSLVVKVPNVLVVNASAPFRNVSDFVTYAKAYPGKLNYASPGVGSSAHLGMELLKNHAKIDVVHVPYSGAPAAIVALLAGKDLHVMFGNAPAQLPHVRKGTLRALAVTSAARNPQLPEVPTMMEAGVRDFEFTVWFGVVAPSGVPQPVLAKLNAELNTVLNSPSVRQAMARHGGQAAPTTRSSFAAFQAAEIAKWADVAQRVGASAD